MPPSNEHINGYIEALRDLLEMLQESAEPAVRALCGVTREKIASLGGDPTVAPPPVIPLEFRHLSIAEAQRQIHEWALASYRKQLSAPGFGQALPRMDLGDLLAELHWRYEEAVHAAQA